VTDVRAAELGQSPRLPEAEVAQRGLADLAADPEALLALPGQVGEPLGKLRACRAGDVQGAEPRHQAGQVIGSDVRLEGEPGGLAPAALPDARELRVLHQQPGRHQLERLNRDFAPHPAHLSQGSVKASMRPPADNWLPAGLPVPQSFLAEHLRGRGDLRFGVLPDGLALPVPQLAPRGHRHQFVLPLPARLGGSGDLRDPLLRFRRGRVGHALGHGPGGDPRGVGADGGCEFLENWACQFGLGGEPVLKMPFRMRPCTLEDPVGADMVAMEGRRRGRRICRGCMYKRQGHSYRADPSRYQPLDQPPEKRLAPGWQAQLPGYWGGLRC
jgi:hypothetical protein